MKNTYFKFIIIVSVLSTFILGCEFNQPYPGYNTGYSDPYYGGGYNDGYYSRREAERARSERYRLERERNRVEDERRRLEQERWKNNKPVYRPQAPVYRPQPQRKESCPPGFSPSERKCSNEERRRGCKDIRLPGGLGCVKR